MKAANKIAYENLSTVDFNSSVVLAELVTYLVVVNLCFTSLFGTKGLLSDIVIR